MDYITKKLFELYISLDGYVLVICDAENKRKEVVIC